MRPLPLTSHPDPVVAAALPAEPQRVTIDIPEAIHAHVLWKLRLQNYVSGRGERLDAAVVGSDCNCPLGRWIHGEGEEAYGPHPVFREIRALHAEFHRCAGAVVAAVHAGDRERAEAILASQAFLDSSGQIKKKLAAIFLEFEF